jgi:hypothetical protein
MSPLYGPSASAASNPSERSRHTAQPPRKSANGPADKAHRGHAHAADRADCSMSACRHEPQNGLPDPSSPQTGHDQGNIKAASASLTAMSQSMIIRRAATDRDDSVPKRKERKEIIFDDLKTSRLISAHLGSDGASPSRNHEESFTAPPRRADRSRDRARAVREAGCGPVPGAI